MFTQTYGLIPFQNLEAEQTEKEHTNNSHIFVREILLRLACLALCAEVNNYGDGNKIINILDTFITKLNQ